MKKIETFLLIVILITAFIVRLYKITSPLADWHSWRQVDTSAVSRNFVQSGFDVLRPRFDDLSNVPSGLDNPEGYRFVEFPLFNISHAGLYLIFNSFSLETWGRLVSVFAAVLSTFFIFSIVKKHSDIVTAFFSAFFFAVLPFNIYYGRAILPDTSMVAAILGGIYFFDLWIAQSIEHKDSSIKYWALYVTAIVFTASALLLKPYALFFTLPMIYLSYRKYKIKLFTQWKLWMFLIASIVPLIAWRYWMTAYPEGVPVSDWLFNGGNIRFKGAYFYWLFADRIGRLILGYWGTGIFIIGLLVSSGSEQLKKNGTFFYTFLLSSVIYLTIIARGNVQHDYYQILIIPSIVIFMGFGARALLFPHPNYINIHISRMVLLTVTVFTVGFGWYFVRDYYNINNSAILIAGKAVDELLPKDAKVVAPYNGDTTFLYYTKRKGWASFQNSLPEMVKKGATHLVLVNPTEADLGIATEYKVIANTKEYLIFDLNTKL